MYGVDTVSEIQDVRLGERRWGHPATSKHTRPHAPHGSDDPCPGSFACVGCLSPMSLKGPVAVQLSCSSTESAVQLRVQLK
eukprot:scaffold72484_cov56-Phaeocystis_antarctica.AAC.2